VSTVIINDIAVIEDELGSAKAGKLQADVERIKQRRLEMNIRLRKFYKKIRELTKEIERVTT